MEKVGFYTAELNSLSRSLTTKNI